MMMMNLDLRKPLRWAGTYKILCIRAQDGRYLSLYLDSCTYFTQETCFHLLLALKRAFKSPALMMMMFELSQKVDCL